MYRTPFQNGRNLIYKSMVLDEKFAQYFATWQRKLLTFVSSDDEALSGNANNELMTQLEEVYYKNGKPKVPAL